MLRISSRTFWAAGLPQVPQQTNAAFRRRKGGFLALTPCAVVPYIRTTTQLEEEEGIRREIVEAWRSCEEFSVVDRSVFRGGWGRRSASCSMPSSAPARWGYGWFFFFLFVKSKKNILFFFWVCSSRTSWLIFALWRLLFRSWCLGWMPRAKPPSCTSCTSGRSFRLFLRLVCCWLLCRNIFFFAHVLCAKFEKALRLN